MFTSCVAMLVASTVAVQAESARISGVITTAMGTTLPGAVVMLREVATGHHQRVVAAADGTYQFAVPQTGTYLVSATRPGFSEAARTVVIERLDQRIDLPLALDIGGFQTEITVTATRGERELRHVPLHVDSLAGTAIEQLNPLSTGDAMATAANITPVGGGPFGVRPRLRGLDSTRLLVLVDGERLNTARMATDRTGAEVGLVATESIQRMEVVSGAGTLMYGSDALAGTINIITREPAFTPTTEWLRGFQGFYSTNERGRRGTVTLGATAPRYTLRLQAGREEFDNYRAGRFDVEDTAAFLASGQIPRLDTVDQHFGFNLNAFGEPFNAPYRRTDREVLNSQARGEFVTAAGQIRLAERRVLRLRYQRREMTDVGFPDFASPYFFNAISLPFSTLEKFSTRYQAQAVTRWLANLSLTAYSQSQSRLLQNLLPLQYPAPTPVTLFPVTVMRLDVLSRTEQRVWTPGVDLQAVLVPAVNHRLTTGFTFYQDRSSDRRTTETTTSLVGQVVAGPRGPSAVVLPSPMRLGSPVHANPVRVPNARFRDAAVFAQDEWRVHPVLSIIGGLRADLYRVMVDPTPGYDVASVVAGAQPSIDPATLPSATGGKYSRNAVTGDIGLVATPDGRLTPFIRWGRSYRHPNLEEMLFAGPATAGHIAPNTLVKPERGNNFDLGTKFRAGRLAGAVYVFHNRYDDFIAQDLVVAVTPAGPLAQATNFADVHISGVELAADAPLLVRGGVLTLSGSTALMRGTIARGIDPLNGAQLDGTPADNITPVKSVFAARFTRASGLWWAEYGGRAQGEVARVAKIALESPFLIPQDLLSLQGFAIHRVALGVNLTRGRDRAGVVVAVENLTDRYFREHFQFAPARGRSLTFGVNIGAF
jgi:hemoglobin/transferrin/lactoferrin receptor protein